MLGGVKVLVTGGSGVLGRAVLPRLVAAGHEVRAPTRADLDLTDVDAVSAAVAGVDGALHLATRIPPPDRRADPAAWRDNDRLRRQTTRWLVDAALAGSGVSVIVVPTVAFVYPPGPADESTPLTEVPAFLESALDAEREVARFASRSGRRGVVLRLGLLYGPGAATAEPDARFGATLSTDLAGAALATALRLAPGLYNVVDPGGEVSGAKFAAASLRV